jgi:hypothetical protein
MQAAVFCAADPSGLKTANCRALVDNGARIFAKNP